MANSHVALYYQELHEHFHICTINHEYTFPKQILGDETLSVKFQALQVIHELLKSAETRLKVITL